MAELVEGPAAAGLFERGPGSAVGEPAEPGVGTRVGVGEDDVGSAFGDGVPELAQNQAVITARVLSRSSGLGRFEGEAGEVCLLGVFCSSDPFCRSQDPVGIDLVLEACHEGSPGRLGVLFGVDAGVEGMSRQPGSECPLVWCQGHIGS